VSLLNLLLLGIVVSANNLAISLALGALNRHKSTLQIVLVFGLFEFFLPLIGLWLGSITANLIASYASVTGAVLLILLGIATIIGGTRNNDQDKKLARHITSLKGLVLLAAGLSLDNLVVGFSLGLDKASPLLVAGTIAGFSMLFTFTGLKLGRFANRKWQKITKVGAGLLLALLGIAIGVSLF